MSQWLSMRTRMGLSTPKRMQDSGPFPLIGHMDSIIL